MSDALEVSESEQEPQWTKVISAKRRLLDLRLKEVWDYKYLIKLFIKRDFVVNYKQTVLGPLWYVLNPIFSSIVWMFIFGQLAQIGTNGIPYILFYYGGNMLWGFFNASLVNCAGVFSANAGIFGKVYFPRLTVPISLVAGQVIKLAIQFALLICLYVYFILTGSAVRPTWWVFAIPLIVIWIGVMGGSMGMIISSLTTKYRDLNMLLGFGMSLAMYATPVVYPLSEAPKRFMWIFYANPMSAPMELFRVFFYGAGHVPYQMIISSIATTLVLLFFGLVLFCRNERTFVDVI